jgi:hypothetical protein
MIICKTLLKIYLKFFFIDITPEFVKLNFEKNYFVLFEAIKRYTDGTRNKVRKVDTIKPPITEMPIAIRPLAPSALANANGNKPSTVEKLVIKIGRNRCTAAPLMATN